MENVSKSQQKNLPLLDSVLDYYSNIRFQLTALIVCHHILESNLFLIDYLIRLGIKPKDIFVIGKSYSTSPQMIKHYLAYGITLHRNSLAFDSHMSFDEQFKTSIRDFLREIQKRDLSKYEKIIVLDDGGELLAQVHDAFQGDSRIAGVEQTASGYHKLRLLSPLFPVINVATSWAKLEYESPFIAESFVKELYKRLNQMDKKIETILILGNGMIGSNIASILKGDCRVFVYDSHIERSELSKEELNNILPVCDAIIGCSGQISMIEPYYSKVKKGVIFASASSSDREFESYKIRRSHEKTSNPHKDFYTDHIILLNAGFPLNFDGDKLSVSLDKIQLTLALMLAGAIQTVCASGRKGILELDVNVQNVLIRKFNEIISARSYT